jgi:hypothetical protein
MRQGGLYTEFLVRVATRFGVPQSHIIALSFEGVNVLIEDDGDVLQLEDDETVEVTISEEDEGQHEEDEEDDD